MTTAPPLFGTFHLVASLLCFVLPLVAAYLLRKTDAGVRLRILFGCGCVLLLLELYKQWYFFTVIHDGIYDCSIFPFQQCSLPMILCLLLPLCRGSVRNAVIAFLFDYVGYAAVLALVYPEGMLRPYLPMTLHGFIWHAILVFIALLVFFSDAYKPLFTWRSFTGATTILLCACLIATVINVLLEGKGLTGTYPDMFYLTPYHMTAQPVASDIEASFGRLTARITYVLALILLGAVSHMLFLLAHRRHNKRIINCLKAYIPFP